MHFLENFFVDFEHLSPHPRSWNKLSPSLSFPPFLSFYIRSVWSLSPKFFLSTSLFPVSPSLSSLMLPQLQFPGSYPLLPPHLPLPPFASSLTPSVGELHSTSRPLMDDEWSKGCERTESALLPFPCLAILPPSSTGKKSTRAISPRENTLAASQCIP